MVDKRVTGYWNWADTRRDIRGMLRNYDEDSREQIRKLMVQCAGNPDYLIALIVELTDQLAEVKGRLYEFENNPELLAQTYVRLVRERERLEAGMRKVAEVMDRVLGNEQES